MSERYTGGPGVMIENLFNNPRVLWQKPVESDFELPEQPIVCSVDSGGLIVISQENRHITINSKSVPQLKKMLDEQARWVRSKGQE